MVEKSKAQNQHFNSLVDKFAADPAIREILEAKTAPRAPERRREEGSGAFPEFGPTFYKAPDEAPQRTYEETFEHYRSALYAINSSVSLARELLRAEQFRTRVGSRTWDALGALATKVGEIQEEISGMLSREVPPSANGLLE